MIWLNKKEIEHPIRIKNFLEHTLEIDWNNFKEAKKVLYKEINDLCQAEIEYYYFKRKRKRFFSTTVKVLMFSFFLLGLLCPLLSNIAEVRKTYPELNNFGYIFIAVTGSLFTLDRLFTGSSGHIRFVTTQLRLEKEITLFRVNWNKLDSQDINMPDPFFKILLNFMNHFYLIISEETMDWSNEINKVLEEFKKAGAQSES